MSEKRASHIAEQFDAVPDAVYAASLEQLLHGDGLRRVDETSVDPVLQAVEVEWGHLLVEAVAREGSEAKVSAHRFQAARRTAALSERGMREVEVQLTGS